ncbi:MAG: DUF3857 domain-containing protein [Opitutaceae bacterium]|nr:DUF3857 domain-containing protein [Opitutaceae bacterium]
MLSRLFYAFAVGAIACTLHAEVPDWLTAIAAKSPSVIGGSAPAVVLLDEQDLDVDNRGQLVTTYRRAVRILHPAGKEEAFASVFYNGKSDKVLAAEAWLLRGKKPVKTVKKSEWADLTAEARGSIEDENRSRVCGLTGEALAGDVFGFEATVRSSLLIAQCWNVFGGSLPCLTERMSVTVPAGFRIREQFFGEQRPAVARSADGRRCVWTAFDRPYRPEETLPGRSAFIDAELCVSIDPPDSATNFTPKRFASWGEVATWSEQFNEDAFDTSPLLAAKARELAGASGDTLAKIRALAGYVQELRYIAINRDLHAGHGYKARKASLVFANGFGDCKDKANLLRAMLREAGIHAYMAIALVGRTLEVHPECPTPVQFDHAVVAIAVDPSVDLPSVVQVDKLGRLLLFDPTDKYTPVGDLPQYLQGTRVLLLSRDCEGLLEVPVFTPENDFKVVRKAEIKLLPDGSASMAGKVEGFGQGGAILRAAITQADVPAKLEELVTRQLSDSFKGAVIQEKTTEDDRVDGRCGLSFTCISKRFVQRLPGSLSIVKLDVLNRHYLPVLAETERHIPMLCEPLCLDDEITLHIPAGQHVEERPADASGESPYGSYRISFETVDGAIVMHRRVSIKKKEIPAEDYAQLKSFLSEIARADRCSVILASGPG